MPFRHKRIKLFLSLYCSIAKTARKITLKEILNFINKTFLDKPKPKVEVINKFKKKTQSVQNM